VDHPPLNISYQLCGKCHVPFINRHTTRAYIRGTVLTVYLNGCARLVDDNVRVGEDESVLPHNEPGTVRGGDRLPGEEVSNTGILEDTQHHSNYRQTYFSPKAICD
jgi:hypothetical protein